MNTDKGTLSIKGSIVGVYEKEGKIISIIKHEEGIFETEYKFPENVHLEDKINIVSKIEKIDKLLK